MAAMVRRDQRAGSEEGTTRDPGYVETYMAPGAMRLWLGLASLVLQDRDQRTWNHGSCWLVSCVFHSKQGDAALHLSLQSAVRLGEGYLSFDVSPLFLSSPFQFRQARTVHTQPIRLTLHE